MVEAQVALDRNYSMIINKLKIANRSAVAVEAHREPGRSLRGARCSVGGYDRAGEVDFLEAYEGAGEGVVIEVVAEYIDQPDDDSPGANEAGGNVPVGL